MSATAMSTTAMPTARLTANQLLDEGLPSFRCVPDCSSNEFTHVRQLPVKRAEWV
jgi:hypothetical protein